MVLRPEEVLHGFGPHSIILLVVLGEQSLFDGLLFFLGFGFLLSWDNCSFCRLMVEEENESYCCQEISNWYDDIIINLD